MWFFWHFPKELGRELRTKWCSENRRATVLYCFSNSSSPLWPAALLPWAPLGSMRGTKLSMWGVGDPMGREGKVSLNFTVLSRQQGYSGWHLGTALPDQGFRKGVWVAVEDWTEQERPEQSSELKGGYSLRGVEGLGQRKQNWRKEHERIWLVTGHGEWVQKGWMAMGYQDTMKEEGEKQCGETRHAQQDSETRERSGGSMCESAKIMVT